MAYGRTISELIKLILLVQINGIKLKLKLYGFKPGLNYNRLN